MAVIVHKSKNSKVIKIQNTHTLQIIEVEINCGIKPLTVYIVQTDGGVMMLHCTITFQAPLVSNLFCRYIIEF